MQSSERKLILTKFLVYNLKGGQNNEPDILKDAAIEVENNRIVNITKASEVSKSSFDNVLNLDHHIVLPGLVNTHSHAGMTLYRGMADDLDLHTWLNEYIWPAEANTSAKDVYLGAKLAAIEALLSGTTTFNSMYWHVPKEAKAFSEIGVRLLCGQGILDGIAKLDLTKAEKLLNEFHGKANDMTRIGIFPHAPYTVTDEEYIKIHEFQQKFNSNSSNHPNLVMHTHLHEASNEMEFIRDFAGQKGFTIPQKIKTPTSYLNNLGVLNEQTFLAHAVGMNMTDIKILKKHNVGLSHNPSSNLKLGNRIAPVISYLDSEMKIGLGTDSATSNNNLDMFEEIKLTALLHKGVNEDPLRPKASEVLKMATLYGGQAMNWEGTGDISVGSYADMIAVDVNTPHLTPLIKPQTIISHLVYSTKGSDVSHVIVNGDLKVENKTIINFDLNGFLEKYTDNAENLYAKIFS